MMTASSYKKTPFLLLTMMFLASMPGAQPLQAVDETQLFASDPGRPEVFGVAVAADSEFLFVGSWDGTLGSAAGAVYIFERTGGTWLERVKLMASDGATGDRFGSALAVDGETLVVGAPTADAPLPDSGAAYVFERAGNDWVERSKLTPSDPTEFDRFGTSVAVEGDTIIVGNPSDDDVARNVGSAYVFERLGDAWLESAELHPTDPIGGGALGQSVSLSGALAAVGAYTAWVDGVPTGRAYVFRDTGTTWVQEKRVVPADPTGGTEFFGYTVAIEGDELLVGAPWGEGSVRVFQRDGGGWTQSDKLVGSNAHAGAEFGFSLARDGDVLAVGARRHVAGGVSEAGSVYLFRDEGTLWNEEAYVHAAVPLSHVWYGFSVGLAERTLLAGARNHGNGVGSVYAYELNDPPVAVVADVPVAECVEGGASVRLDASGSFDPDGDPITFAWTVPDVQLDDPAAADPSGTFPLGVTMARVTVTDVHGAADSADVQVEVVDTLPPTNVIMRPMPGSVYLFDEPVRHGVREADPVAVGNLTVVADPQDQCGVARVTFASSTGAGAVVTSAPYAFVSAPEPPESGEIAVVATAVDLGGHASEAMVRFVQVAAGG